MQWLIVKPLLGEWLMVLCMLRLTDWLVDLNLRQSQAIMETCTGFVFTGTTTLSQTLYSVERLALAFIKTPQKKIILVKLFIPPFIYLFILNLPQAQAHISLNHSHKILFVSNFSWLICKILTELQATEQK